MPTLNTPPFQTQYSQMCGQLADGTPVVLRMDQNGNLPVAISGRTIPTTFLGGTKTVSESDIPEPLVAESTSCQFVWLGARVDGDGVGLNDKPVFVGDAESQNIPIMPTNYEGMVIQVDDAAKLFVKAGADGEGVAYRVFA